MQPPACQACCETGTLVEKGGCYALRRDDGTEVWLELDPIPLHLLADRITVAGMIYSGRVIAVDTIGPG